MYDVQKYDNYFKDGDFMLYEGPYRLYLCYIDRVNTGKDSMDIIHLRKPFGKTAKTVCYKFSNCTRYIFKVTEFYNDDIKHRFMRSE